MIGKQTMLSIDKRIKKDLQEEIIDQGHHLTGALEKSIRSNVNLSNDISLEVKAVDYIDPLNEGVTASHIPYDSSTNTGAIRSEYIQGLKQFAKLRFGLDDKAALGAAFAIAKTHEKEGMPTKGSYAYSKTGKRTQVVEDTFEHNDYDKILETGVSDEIDATFNFPDLTLF